MSKLFKLISTGIFAFTFFTGGMLIGLSNIFSVNTNNIVFIYLEFVPVCIIGLICIKIMKAIMLLLLNGNSHIVDSLIFGLVLKIKKMPNILKLLW